ncbi:MAG TPA: glycosyltransferase family 4 protein [Thermoanaerobaculia bacterium]|nr:glycosyltransferase family 4 protein [Thermoanaerobaculia bacterium]
MRVLYVATKPPWPPVDGGRLVLKNTVEALAAAGDDVTVVCPGASAPPAPPDVRVITVPGSPWAEETAFALAHGLPVAIARHASRRLAEEVGRRIAGGRPDVVFAEQLQALPGCGAAFRAGVPVVLRAQNVESDLWKARSAIAGPGRSVLFRIEARRLARWEGDAIARCAAVVALTERDADRLRTLSRGAGSVFAVPAPFPAELPAADAPLPGSPALVLLAGGRWWANADGARWFLREIWPALRERLPAARLHLFGGESAALPDVVPHPAPADSREAFAPGSVFIVALRAASGVRMKILEAWARGVPVVATRAAAAGLGRTDALLLADDAAGFVAAVESLAARPAEARRLAELGRRELVRSHDPAAVAARLREIAAAAGAAHARGSSTADRRSSA